MTDQACQTPMSDHIVRFWELLATEHVRILIDIRRDHDEGQPPHWDSASFPDDNAKALVAERSTLQGALEKIAAMDPKGIRADDLGRAARIATAALIGAAPRDDWPAWFPASPADVERGEELFFGGYTWTLRGGDGPKHYRYRDGRWHRVEASGLPPDRSADDASSVVR